MTDLPDVTVESDPETKTPQRDDVGHYMPGHRLGFLPGNEVRRTHGVKSFENHGESSLPPDIREAMYAFRDGVESDQGGADNLTTIRAGYVRRLADLEAICYLLAEDLRVRGLLTPRGRVRGTYAAFLATLDRWDRVAQRLGMDRRQKPVPSLSEIMAE